MKLAVRFQSLTAVGITVLGLVLISSPPLAVPQSAPTVRVSIQPSTNRFVAVTWAPPQATLQSGPTVGGSFANVAGASTPHRVDTRLASARGYRACLPSPSFPTIFIWTDAMTQPGRAVLDWSPRNKALEQTANFVQWQTVSTPPTDWYYPPTPLEPGGGVLAGMRFFRVANSVALNDAPDGVFSVNIIGYVNLAFRVGQSNYFSFILRGINQSLNTLLPLPDEAGGTRLHFYDPATQSFGPANEFIGNGIGWLNPAGEVPLANQSHQSAALIFPQSSTPGAVTVSLTTVGEFPQGTFQRTLPPGYSLNGPLVPIRGGITSTHALNPNEGDLVLLFNPATRSFDAYEHFGFQWEPAEPVVGAGDAFYYVNTSGVPLIWTRSFMLN